VLLIEVFLQHPFDPFFGVYLADINHQRVDQRDRDQCQQPADHQQPGALGILDGLHMAGAETHDEEDQIRGQHDGHEVGEKQQEAAHAQHQLAGAQAVARHTQGGMTAVATATPVAVIR